jgi:hypothetical protein
MRPATPDRAPCRPADQPRRGPAQLPRGPRGAPPPRAAEDGGYASDLTGLGAPHPQPLRRPARAGLAGHRPAPRPQRGAIAGWRAALPCAARSLPAGPPWRGIQGAPRAPWPGAWGPAAPGIKTPGRPEPGAQRRSLRAPRAATKPGGRRSRAPRARSADRGPGDGRRGAAGAQGRPPRAQAPSAASIAVFSSAASGATRLE